MGHQGRDGYRGNHRHWHCIFLLGGQGQTPGSRSQQGLCPTGQGETNWVFG